MYIYIYILKKKKKKSDNKMGAWKRKKKFKLNGNEQKPLWWSIQAICSCSAKSQVHLSLICYTSSDSGMGWMWTESADSVAQKKKKNLASVSEVALRCALRTWALCLLGANCRLSPFRCYLEIFSSVFLLYAV